MSAGREAPTLPGLTLLQHLGSGGYAEVYLYEQHMPKLKVAVKVLNADSLDEKVQAQFTAEANTMAQLSDHPFIVPVMRADITDDGRPFIVMKYFPNPNLGVRARREQFSVTDVLRIGVQVSSAVETAHRAGIAHRDIKPANILTGPYGDPGLTDFGIAATAAEDGDRAEGMSVPWSPPEVLYGVSDGDVRSDVYSLGATLWHLLSGRSPYEDPGGDNSTIALMKRIQQDPVPSVRRDDVPESLQRLLRQTLAKSPDSRPQSALVVARSLQAIEQELRLAKTQIVVPEQAASPAHQLGDEGEGERTAVRAARVVQAQPQDGVTTARAPHVEPQTPIESELATTARAAVVEPQPRQRLLPAGEPAPERTVRRVRPEPAAEATPEVPVPTTVLPATRSKARVVVPVLVGVVAVAGLGVALAGGATAKKPSSSAVDPGLQQNPFGTHALEAPGVTVSSLAAGKVRFAFSNPDPQAGDVYRWSSYPPPGVAGPSTPVANTTASHVDLAAPVCVRVEINRGGSGSMATVKCSG